MKSPIAYLTEVLQTVKDAAETFRPQLQGNESATRAALIDPVLQALGWNIADPGRVLIEKTQTVHGQALRVDYALMVDSEVGIIVEAKKLGGNIKEHFLQLVTYSFGLHVGSLFITDGLRWQHYVNLTHDNDSPSREFDLEQDPLPQIAAYLMQHLDSALVAPETPPIDKLAERVESVEQEIEGLRQALSTLRASLPTSPNSSASATSSESTNIAEQPTGVFTSNGPAIETDSTRFEPQNLEWKKVNPQAENYTKTKPTHFRLPDGDIQVSSNWAKVLVESCRFALINAPQLQDQLPIPDKSGGTIALVTREKPAGPLSYKALLIGERTFWVCTNYSAPSAAANCLYILDKVSVQKRPYPLAVVLR